MLARPGRRSRAPAPSRSGGSRPPRPSSARWPRRPRKIGCSLALYNHGGWFGEPENQIAIIERLEGAGRHQRRHRLQPAPRPRPPRPLRRRCSRRSMPYLVAVNLNGMDPGGDRVGRKILPLGQGALRPRAAADHPRQRLPRADRHPRPHAGRRRGAARATTSTASTGWCRSSTASRRARARSRARPCRRRRRAKPRPARTPLRPTTAPMVAAPASRDARAARRLRPRGRGLRLAEVRLPVVPPGRRPGGDGRPRPVDGGRLPQARGDRRVASSGPRRQVKEGYAAVTVATADGKVRQGYKQAETPRRAGAPRPGHGRTVPDRQGRHRGRAQRRAR